MWCLLGRQNDGASLFALDTILAVFESASVWWTLAKLDWNDICVVSEACAHTAGLLVRRQQNLFDMLWRKQVKVVKQYIGPKILIFFTIGPSLLDIFVLMINFILFTFQSLDLEREERKMQ
jgi:hypothetical protein